MDYKTTAQSILQALPESQLQPKRRFQQSDDDRIAQVVWMRMQLELNISQTSSYPLLTLV